MSKYRDKIFLVGLLLILFFLETFVMYHYVTSIVPGANDYYSRWAGARALLVEGRNPYGLDVTYEIQEIIAIDHSEVGRGGFAYPLHVLFLFWPLVYMPYTWAQAFWLVMLQWMAIGAGILLLSVNKCKPSPGLLVAVLLLVLTFYPITRSIFMGQFTIPVLLFLSLSLWLLRREQDGWAGVALALTSIKPQMVIFVAPWILLWVLSQRRYRFFAGFFGAGILLLLSSMVLHPSWPLDFWQDTQLYRQVAGGRNPLALMLAWLWPGYPQPLFYAIAGGLTAVTLWKWWQGWGGDESRFTQGLHWAIVVSLLITFQTGTTNYVLLLIPIFAWLTLLAGRFGRWPAVMVAAGLNLALWVLFLRTVDGNAESLALFLPLPWLCLAVLVGLDLWQWRVKRLTAVTAPEEVV